MTDTQKLKKAISIIKTLREDAKLALNNDWDKSNSGFENQIILIDSFFNEINKKQEGLLKQIKLNL